ncbi:MAG: tyrosine-type recombinase/integrase [Fusobacterium sp. JB019]|nr:tyrosine-type recombinase/integrase [Fusobacterium sp. JB019]
MGKKNANSMKFWKKDEYDIFIKGIEDKIMSKVIYDILFYTGIRVGELLALTLNDFNFETKVMSVTKTYAKLKGGKDLIQEPKIPKSRREIVIPGILCDEVKKIC